MSESHKLIKVYNFLSLLKFKQQMLIVASRQWHNQQYSLCFTLLRVAPNTA